jgi:hypothetical protein
LVENWRTTGTQQTKAAAVIIIILLGQNLNKLSFKVFEKIKNKYFEQHSTFSRKAQCSTALA